MLDGLTDLKNLVSAVPERVVDLLYTRGRKTGGPVLRAVINDAAVRNSFKVASEGLLTWP